MFQVHDSFTLKVKRCSKTIRNFIVFVGATSLALSVLYAMYYGLATNGDIVIEYTQQVYSPLVSLFFDDINLLDNYLQMSKYLLLFTVPCLVAHYLVQKTEETIIFLHEKKTQKLENKRIEKEAIEAEKEFTNIKSFSICLSFDFSNNQNLKSDFSSKFYSYLAKTIKKKLDNVSNDIQISVKNAILIYSKDFENYDEIYSVVSNEVKRAKSMLGDKISAVPTITVDAYDSVFVPYNAIAQHFDIVKCNLKGRATTTSLFRKKYTHINKSKYAGTPIGLYTTFKNDNYIEYDLNVIQKTI